jgi:hypothetical protein
MYSQSPAPSPTRLVYRYQFKPCISSFPSYSALIQFRKVSSISAIYSTSIISGGKCSIKRGILIGGVDGIHYTVYWSKWDPSASTPRRIHKEASVRFEITYSYSEHFMTHLWKSSSKLYHSFSIPFHPVSLTFFSLTPVSFSLCEIWNSHDCNADVYMWHSFCQYNNKKI